MGSDGGVATELGCRCVRQTQSLDEQVPPEGRTKAEPGKRQGPSLSGACTLCERARKDFEAYTKPFSILSVGSYYRLVESMKSEEL
jgi:hypothetical protein